MDNKLALKKLNIVCKYINFQNSIGTISTPIAKEIKKYVKEAMDCLHEKETAVEEAKIS